MFRDDFRGLLKAVAVAAAEVSRAVTASLKCTDKTALDRVVEMLQNGDIGLQPKKRASEELLR